jgi:nitroimidazol reductase NimA-like FMN-containing flavoprotein (pyridoxamine 5'-phosphate oxidase superfamily)
MECEVGRVGTAGPDGTPYITPMHYAYDPESNRICLHVSSKKGHLLANLERSSKACFEVDEVGELAVEGNQGCAASQSYRSVVCFGEMRVVSDPQEKERISWLLIDKYVRKTGLSENPTIGPVDDILCLEMDIQIMTGKERKSG